MKVWLNLLYVSSVVKSLSLKRHAKTESLNIALQNVTDYLLQRLKPVSNVVKNFIIGKTRCFVLWSVLVNLDKENNFQHHTVKNYPKQELENSQTKIIRNGRVMTLGMVLFMIGFIKSLDHLWFVKNAERQKRVTETFTGLIKAENINEIKMIGFACA